jgi:Rap1a immunity proteins
MRYAAFLALIVGLLGGAQTARAEDLTVGQLLQDCNFNLEVAQTVEGVPPGKAKKVTLTRIARHLVCIAYIRGSLETHVVLFTRLGRAARVYCAPGKVEVRTAAALLRGWAKKDPERGRLPAAIGLDAALRDAYSCLPKP